VINETGPINKTIIINETAPYVPPEEPKVNETITVNQTGVINQTVNETIQINKTGKINETININQTRK
jgi:hypothetical protein